MGRHGIDCEYVCRLCEEAMKWISTGEYRKVPEEELLRRMLNCDICEDFCKPAVQEQGQEKSWGG